jgi:hypothetical protein
MPAARSVGPEGLPQIQALDVRPVRRGLNPLPEVLAPVAGRHASHEVGKRRVSHPDTVRAYSYNYNSARRASGLRPLHPN